MSSNKWISLRSGINPTMCEDRKDLAVINSSIVWVVQLSGSSSNQ